MLTINGFRAVLVGRTVSRPTSQLLLIQRGTSTPSIICAICNLATDKLKPRAAKAEHSTVDDNRSQRLSRHHLYLIYGSDQTIEAAQLTAVHADMSGHAAFGGTGDVCHG